MHESSLHELSSFVTLTYDDEHLPPGGSLLKVDLQKFMRKLRKKSIGRIRFYACGEYGETSWRPHYHLLLFGVAFSDQRPWKKTPAGQLYTSASLASLWGKGFASIGPVTWETAAYAARYVMKKMTGKRAPEHYRRVDVETGELVQLLPEFNTMSLKPGIGKDWFKRYHTDLYPDDFVVAGGVKRGKPPRYYDKLLEASLPPMLSEVKARRIARALEPRQAANSTRARLAVREAVTKARVNLRQRNLS